MQTKGSLNRVEREERDLEWWYAMEGQSEILTSTEPVLCVRYCAKCFLHYILL